MSIQKIIHFMDIISTIIDMKITINEPSTGNLSGSRILTLSLNMLSIE